MKQIENININIIRDRQQYSLLIFSKVNTWLMFRHPSKQQYSHFYHFCRRNTIHYAFFGWNTLIIYVI